MVKKRGLRKRLDRALGAGGAKKRLKQRGARISVRWEGGRFLLPFHRNIDTSCLP